jgi:hypothetical protein
MKLPSGERAFVDVLLIDQPRIITYRAHHTKAHIISLRNPSDAHLRARPGMLRDAGPLAVFYREAATPATAMTRGR